MYGWCVRCRFQFRFRLNADRQLGTAANCLELVQLWVLCDGYIDYSAFLGDPGKGSVLNDCKKLKRLLWLGFISRRYCRKLKTLHHWLFNETVLIWEPKKRLLKLRTLKACIKMKLLGVFEWDLSTCSLIFIAPLEAPEVSPFSH